MVSSPDRQGQRQGGAMVSGKRRLNTRLRIVHAAHRLFRDQGYRKTSIAKVAQSLRMSPANVYRFFTSKDDLRKAVTRRLLDADYAQLEKVTRHKGSAAIRLRTVVLMQFAMTCDLHRNFPKLFELLTISGSQNEDLLGQHHKRVAALVSELVAQGVRLGELPPQDVRRNTEVFILSLACLWHPALLVTEAAKSEVEPTELFDFCLGSLRNGFHIPVQKER